MSSYGMMPPHLDPNSKNAQWQREDFKRRTGVRSGNTPAQQDSQAVPGINNLANSEVVRASEKQSTPAVIRVVGLLLGFVVLYMVFGNSGDSFGFGSGQTHVVEDKGIRVTYTGDQWRSIDYEESPACQVFALECILFLHGSSGSVEVRISRMRYMADETTLETLPDVLVGASTAIDQSTAEIYDDSGWTELNGRRVYRASMGLVESGIAYSEDLYLTLDNARLYLVEVLYVDEDVRQEATAEVDSLLATFEIVTPAETDSDTTGS